jgi:hypothetical protein
MDLHGFADVAKPEVVTLLAVATAQLGGEEFGSRGL